ncbi:hypothetical protein Hypma_009316 [Hypsizygus marmoreus]|uniref:RNase III domain-containing protein n=1 Tax=Hypsizygus marmoreus TaxID=39966 RepID=A0A369JYU6_HYPMA|nr:hypothetical protein Hypma_009316 [Hypsizygus marmoreus]
MDIPSHNEIILRSELIEKGITALDPVVQFYLNKAREFRASLSTEDERALHEFWGSNDLKYTSSSIFYAEYPSATPYEHTNLKTVFLSKKGIIAILEATGNDEDNEYGDWLVMAHIASKQSERRLRTILYRVYRSLLPGVFDKIERDDHIALAMENFINISRASGEEGCRIEDCGEEDYGEEDCECPYSWEDLLAAANLNVAPTPLSPPQRRDTTEVIQSLLRSRILLCLVEQRMLLQISENNTLVDSSEPRSLVTSSSFGTLYFTPSSLKLRDTLFFLHSETLGNLVPINMSPSQDPQEVLLDFVDDLKYSCVFPPLKHWLILFSTDTLVLEGLETLGDSILSGLVSRIVEKRYPARPVAFHKMVVTILTTNRTLNALVSKYGVGYPKMKMTYKDGGDFFETFLGASSLEHTKEELLPWAAATFTPLIDVLDLKMNGLSYPVITKSRPRIPKRKIENIDVVDASTTNKRPKREAANPSSTVHAPTISTAPPISAPRDNAIQPLLAPSHAIPLLLRIGRRADDPLSPAAESALPSTPLAKSNVDQVAVLPFRYPSISIKTSALHSTPMDSSASTLLNLPQSDSNGPMKLRRPSSTVAPVSKENSDPLRNDSHRAEAAPLPDVTNAKTLMDPSPRSQLPEAQKSTQIYARPIMRQVPPSAPRSSTSSQTYRPHRL